MRKRIVIGGLAIIALGVLMLVLSQPKKGSVEWHKREFQAAENKMDGVTWLTPLVQVYCKVTGTTRRPRFPGPDEMRVLLAEMSNHRDALLRLGYLVERKFVVSNNLVMFRSVFAKPIIPKSHMGYTVITTSRDSGTNTVKVVGLPADMPKFEEAIRKADVP